jgi:hypothetical protein
MTLVQAEALNKICEVDLGQLEHCIWNT